MADRNGGPHHPLRIGLTGGIGSGKSTVAGFFAGLGVPVIDADAIAAEVVTPGQEGLERIIGLFGREMINREGTLDRARLRARVFADPAARRALEQALHPLIRHRMRDRVGRLQTPYCILEIPLLLEAGWQEEVDRILVVDAPPALQLERAARRGSAGREELERIVATQVARDRRLAAADDIIRNEGSLEALKRQVERLHRSYLQNAREVQDK